MQFVLFRFKTRNTYKRHLRTRHGKVLTTSGGLIILSEDEFQMVRTAPRANSQSSTNVRRSRHQRKPPTLSNQQLETVDEDMQALHQLEVTFYYSAFYSRALIRATAGAYYLIRLLG